MSSKATLVLTPLEENLMTAHLLKLTLGDTNTYSKTLRLFGERALGLYVIICKQHKVDIWLKVVCLLKMTTLSLSSMTAASKDMKELAGKLGKLGFIAQHAGISGWVLTQ